MYGLACGNLLLIVGLTLTAGLSDWVGLSNKKKRVSTAHVCMCACRAVDVYVVSQNYVHVVHVCQAEAM